MSVTFKTQTLEGFGSFQKEVKLNLDRKGLITLVKGTNGEGKTTLFAGLIWTIYGKAIKGINKSKIPTWKELRSANFQGTRGTTEFTVGEYDYLVARHIKYTGETITLKGTDSLMLFRKKSDVPEFKRVHLVNDNRYNGDIQEEIIKIIGINFDQACQSIFFGQNMARLINSKKEDKAKLFEELFEATWLADAKENAKIEKSRLTEKIQLAELESNNLNLLIQEKEKSLDQQKEVLDTFNKDKESNLGLLYNRLDSTEIKISERLLDKEVQEKLADKYDKYAVEVLELKLKSLLQDTSLDKLKVELLEQEQQLEESISIYIEELDTAKASQKEDCKIAYDSVLEAEENLTKYIKLVKGKKIKLEDSIEGLKAERQKLARYGKEIKEILEDVETKKEKLEKELLHLKTDCPTCKQKLPKSDIEKAKKIISDNISKELEVISTLEEKKQPIREKYENLSASIEQNKQLLEENEIESTKKIEELSKNIETLSSVEESVVESHKQNINRIEALVLSAKTDKGSNIQELKSRISETSNKIIRETRETKEAIETTTENNKKYKLAEQQVKLIESELEGLKNALELVSSDLKTEKAKKPPKTNIPELEAEIKQTQNDNAEITLQLTLDKETLAKVQWWFTTGFGSKGVKPYIFSAGLIRLNEAITKYATSLGYTIKFGVNHESSNKDFTTIVGYTKEINGKSEEFQKDYEEFSGGQQQRINLALAFAMFDMISEKAGCNIFILDEAFSGLDEAGKRDIFNLIRFKASEGKSIYVITHFEDIDSKYTKSIHVCRENNSSVVRES